MRPAGRLHDGLVSFINEVSGGTRTDLTVVEIGSYRGESAQIMLDSGRVKRIYCVDPWVTGFTKVGAASYSDMEQVEREFDNVHGKDTRVTKVKGTIVDFIKRYRTGAPDDPVVDLVYIDGSHIFPDVRSDILDALAGIRPRIAVGGHDYDDQHPAVRAAVSSLFPGGADAVFSDGSWVVYKERFNDAHYVPRVIYQFWFPRKPMSPNRLKAFETRGKIGIPVEVVDPNNLRDYEVPEDPIHPAFGSLMPQHAADYLRAYFLRHFGGGYTDIKHYGPDNNWNECFDRINKDRSIQILGHVEDTCWTNCKDIKAAKLCNSVLECSWMLGRRDTEFTREWYDRVVLLMNNKFYGFKAGDKYPLSYTELLGDIYHKLCLEFYGSSAVAFGLKYGTVQGEYR